MATPTHKLGATGACETGTTTELADKASKTVLLEGPISDLETENQDSHVPTGYTRVRSLLTPTGGGMGRLTINCVKYDEGGVESRQPVRSIVEVDMEEVTYDLIDHPHLSEVRDECEKWLATDAAKRYDGDNYFYTDKDGELTAIDAAAALQFCAAYMAGIKTFVRYYPVIERRSVYKNPPGMTRSGRSFANGSPQFSAKCGKFDAPPVTLSGYAATNWFRGGDRWQERGDSTWELLEKWTYTPEGSGSDHAWIYKNQEQEDE